jgi:transposase
MTIETLGIDIAKNVFQLHGVNRGGRVVFKRRVMRDQLLEVVSLLDRCTRLKLHRLREAEAEKRP